MSVKQKFPRAVALEVAAEVVDALQGACERIICAGSLRRGKAEVGDIEVLYIPRRVLRQSPTDFFSQEEVNLADVEIRLLEARGILARRRNANGSETFGPKNKLMVHRRSGVPVDLFAANLANWWNYLVCRTGPKESNERICRAARARGWKWNPYGSGFTCLGTGQESYPMESERAVFEFVGLPYGEPEERV